MLTLLLLIDRTERLLTKLEIETRRIRLMQETFLKFGACEVVVKMLMASSGRSGRSLDTKNGIQAIQFGIALLETGTATVQVCSTART